MVLPLEGRSLTLAEARQLEELAALLEKEGAAVRRCPMVSIHDAPDAEAIKTWLCDVIAGQFDWLIFYTGEGVRRLLGFAERAGLRDSFITALGQTPTLTRGPKPARAFRELGLSPSVQASMPTTEGLIATLKGLDLGRRRIGLQLFGDPPRALMEFLDKAGAQVHAVLPYVYAPAADADRVEELIRDLAARKIDGIVFTSSPQVERLFEVAKDRSLESELLAGLKATRVAAVGPIVADDLRNRGVEVAICPEQGFVMKNLVQHIRRAFEESRLTPPVQK